MIHRGYHRDNGLAVSKAEHGYLRPFKEFFDNYAVAAVAELFVAHYRYDRVLCFFTRIGDYNALAQREAVGLDDRGYGSCLQIGKGLVHVTEGFIGCGGDSVFFHQILGKHLAAFNDGGVLPGAEAGDADGFQRVHASQHQRIVRRYHGVVNPLFPREGHDAVDILRADRNAGCVRGDPAVPGQSKDLRNLRIFLQFLNDGVFPSAAADNQYLHQ